jgi:hypothetical protein
MVLVVCEGEKTEQTYFRELGRELGTVVVLHVEGCGKDPLTLVRRAEARRDEQRRRSMRHNDPFLAYEAAWCVCDVDDHATLPEARRVASRAEVCLAISNPCFELWFLLHFADQSSHIGRAYLARKLREHVPTYDKHIPFDMLKPHHAGAVRSYCSGKCDRIRSPVIVGCSWRRWPSGGIQV